MLKVLIADDEELIRQLLKRLIDWESLGLEIVAEASNGFEAFDLLVEYTPDIAIVDIRMPGFDGLTLVRKTLELNINVRFILVSGYKQFEYAHEALTMGIQDYLLKPIRKEELIQNLTHVRDSILSANESRAAHAKLHSIAERSAGRARFQFLKDISCNAGVQRPLRLPSWASGKEELSLQWLNSEYHLHLQEGVFQIVICKESGQLKQAAPAAYDSSCLIQLFTNALSPLCYDVVCSVFNHRLCCLLNYENSSSQKATVSAVLKGLFQQLQAAKSLQAGCPFTMGVGIPVSTPVALLQTLRSASVCLDRRLLYGAGQVFTMSGALPPVTLFDLICEADERRFSELFDLNDGESLKRWLLSVLTRAFSSEENLSLVIELSYQLVDMFYKRAKNMRRRDDSDESTKENIYERIACADTRGEIAALLCAMVDERYDMTSLSGSAHVRFAKEYIKENYGADIRLSEIAKAGNINPAYLSRIFSEESGETFSDYLIHYRMQIAKDLLCDISINVSEVAERVGYGDVKHFSKTFKKIVGISPRDYRRLHAH
nr:response regulator [uncultured Oscillibacter sp.]